MGKVTTGDPRLQSIRRLPVLDIIKAATADDNKASPRPLESCRLVPTVVDEVAAADPEREFVSVPRSSRASDGWRKVTFGQIADGVNRVAAQLLERHRAQTTVPVSRTSYEYTKRFPTLAYIGPSDVRYQLFIVACIKAGCKALLISPRNSVEAQLNLFEKTECVAIYCDAGFEDRAHSWAAGHHPGMKVFRAGSVDEWLGVGMPPAPVVPYGKTFEQGRWHPFVVLHTSGSTGLPKPVVVRAGLLALSEIITNLPEFRGTIPTWASLFGIRRLFAPMPSFHAVGAYTPFICTVYHGIRVALPIVDRPLTPQAVIDAVKYADVDCAMLPPTLLEAMSHIPEGVDCLRKMKMTIFAGGPLARDIGNKLVRKDPKEPDIQGVFYTFPEATEFETNDIYVKHPTLPDHWKHYGRVDDVTAVASHPDVKGALAVGQGRFQAAPFIKPVRAVGGDEAQAFIDRVWPTIERVNQETVTHGRIVRQLAALTRPDKPLPRAGKGTEKETAELFERVGLNEEDEAPGQDKVPIDISSVEALAGSIADVFTRVASLGAKGKPLTDDTDFFSVGIDSLQVITASRIIRRGLKAATEREVDADAVAPRVVYSNPTARQLASHLMKTVVGGGEQQQNGVNGQNSDSELMQALLDKYAQTCPTRRPSGGSPRRDPKAKQLGSYLLDIAQADPSVSKVICLNGSADAAERQAKSNADKGLDTRFGKVEFLHADFSKHDLGLGAETYNRLLGEVDRVVHNAWPVNFNHTLVSARLTADDIERNPAVKLLNFYRGMAKDGFAASAGYEMTRTVGISPTFAELEAVTPELMQNWCRQWGF
ncbi:hypothetical protein MAPG_05457 [Magnaporthiopsis poae ATCC 64411]|uniref:Carrier domain-containing protein n=1 Tax=Magnaporthiopsis poae (strain ATCC 64411 / 73-15) TaxID=644358 RepID=A0A0C4DZF7_MAGP6|nr:hypothetical protein MAPG_05457 [Magnaporthiopsis poae ATCC 64411]